MKRLKGICSVCGCTDAEGCEEGCGWANLKHTLCSVCARLSDAKRKTKRAEAVAELGMRLELLIEEALAIKTRMAVLQS